MHAVSLIRLRRRADSGGVAVIVAILLGAGVLMGMGALVTDVGILYAEREELLSGADAAATKIAQVCAKSIEDCTPANGTALAVEYANKNAKDGVSGVTLVCGRGGSLDPCTTAPAENLTACVKLAPATGNFVEVRTITDVPGDATVLPPSFAGALLDGYAGARVAACSRASWGPPGTGALAVTMSICEWNDYTNNGASFPDPPVEQVVYFHTNTNAGSCGAGPSGADAPGGFGWLDDPNRDCRTPVNADGTYGGDTGNNVSNQCKDMLDDLRDSGTPVLMPVYNEVTGTGTTTQYRLEGFAAFVITGWKLSGLSDGASILTGNDYCRGAGGPKGGGGPSGGPDTNGNSDTCLYGYFTQALIPAATGIGGADLGAYVVTLIG